MRPPSSPTANKAPRAQHRRHLVAAALRLPGLGAAIRVPAADRAVAKTGAEAAAPGDGRRRAAVAVPDPRERLRLFRAVDLHPPIHAADGEVPPALGLPGQGDGLGFQGLGLRGFRHAYIAAIAVGAKNVSWRVMQRVSEPAVAARTRG